MRRTIGAVALATVIWGLYPLHVDAQITDPDCQQQFMQAAAPIYQQIVYYANHTSDLPLTPQGRPIVTGWPYSAYGPGNGYGPGSPYGPTFGPWGIGSFGPGFGGPGAYGYTPTGLGGGPSVVAAAIAANGIQALNAFPPGASTTAVANQLAASPGGLAAAANADLIGLGALGQAQAGNVIGASALQQSLIGNQYSGASLRQLVVSNRLSAGSLNAALSSYPSTVGSNLGSMLLAILGYWSNACPPATPENAVPATN